MIKIKEPAAMRLKSIHNLFFVLKLVEEAKKAIKENKFVKFKDEFVKKYGKG